MLKIVLKVEILRFFFSLIDVTKMSFYGMMEKNLFNFPNILEGKYYNQKLKILDIFKKKLLEIVFKVKQFFLELLIRVR
jgi:hypothetical protein